MKTYNQFLSENTMKKFKGLEGPLMKASAWIKKKSIEKLIKDDEDVYNYNGVLIYTGRIVSFDRKVKFVGVISSEAKKPTWKYDFKNGINKDHRFYYDTGNGYKATDEIIVITGYIIINKDGSIKENRGADLKKSLNYMVFK